MFRFRALPLVKVGRLVGQKKKRTNEHMKGLSTSEGRAAKYESLVTWSFRSLTGLSNV